MMVYTEPMRHELIIEKGVRKIIDDAYTHGMVAGVLIGLAVGFMIGYGL